MTTSATRAVTTLAVTDAHEGPVYAADERALYFTTSRPDVAIKRLSLRDRTVSVVRATTRTANGMAMDRDGSLLVCEQGTLQQRARIARLDRATGAMTTVLDSWRGAPLNSPNDVVVARDGTIWFTDPSYGWLQGFRPSPRLDDRVYRYDPVNQDLHPVADDFDKPNGLAFAPDGRTLYVGDSGGPHQVLTFDVDDGRLTNRRVFAVIVPGYPDGLKVAADGRVVVSCATGVQVFSPDADLIDEIDLPGAVNFAFGADDLLYVTADTGVHTVALGS